MGNSDVKIFRVILLALLLLPSLVMAGPNSGVSATLVDFTLPHYQKNELQFVLYGERAVNLGAIITVYNPLIDIVVRKLHDVEVITILKGMKPPVSGEKIDKVDLGRIYPQGSCCCGDVYFHLLRIDHSFDVGKRCACA